MKANEKGVDASPIKAKTKSNKEKRTKTPFPATSPNKRTHLKPKSQPQSPKSSTRGLLKVPPASLDVHHGRRGSGVSLTGNWSTHSRNTSRSRNSSLSRGSPERASRSGYSTPSGNRARSRTPSRLTRTPGRSPRTPRERETDVDKQIQQGLFHAFLGGGMDGLKLSLAAFNSQLQHPWHIASNYKIFAAVLVDIGECSFDSQSTLDIMDDWAAVLQEFYFREDQALLFLHWDTRLRFLPTAEWGRGDVSATWAGLVAEVASRPPVIAYLADKAMDIGYLPTPAEMADVMGVLAVHRDFELVSNMLILMKRNHITLIAECLVPILVVDLDEEATDSAAAIISTSATATSSASTTTTTTTTSTTTSTASPTTIADSMSGISISNPSSTESITTTTTTTSSHAITAAPTMNKWRPILPLLRVLGLRLPLEVCETVVRGLCMARLDEKGLRYAKQLIGTLQAMGCVVGVTVYASLASFQWRAGLPGHVQELYAELQALGRFSREEIQSIFPFKQSAVVFHGAYQRLVKQVDSSKLSKAGLKDMETWDKSLKSRAKAEACVANLLPATVIRPATSYAMHQPRVLKVAGGAVMLTTPVLIDGKLCVKVEALTAATCRSLETTVGAFNKLAAGVQAQPLPFAAFSFTTSKVSPRGSSAAASAPTPDVVRDMQDNLDLIVGQQANPYVVDVVGKVVGQASYITEALEESLAQALGRTGAMGMVGLSIATHIVHGLQLLHASGVIHANLTSESIWLSGSYFPKFFFFHNGLRFNPKQPGVRVKAGTAVGTWSTRAPELWRNESGQADESFVIGPPVDAWSLGCILYELLSGLPVWLQTRQKHKSQVAQEQAVREQVMSDRSPLDEEGARDALQATLRDHFKTHASCAVVMETIMDLLGQCFDPDPAQRPTSAQMFEILDDLRSALHWEETQPTALEVPDYQTKFSLCIVDYNIDRDAMHTEEELTARLAKLEPAVVPDSSFFSNHPNGKCFLDFEGEAACESALATLAAAVRAQTEMRRWKVTPVLKEKLRRPVRRKRRTTAIVMRSKDLVCLLRYRHSYWHFIELRRGGLTKELLEQHMANSGLIYRDRGAVENRHEVVVAHLGRSPALQVKTALVYDLIMAPKDSPEHPRNAHPDELRELSREAERQLLFSRFRTALEKVVMDNSSYYEMKWVPVSECSEYLHAENLALCRKVIEAFPAPVAATATPSASVHSTPRKGDGNGKARTPRSSPTANRTPRASPNGKSASRPLWGNDTPTKAATSKEAGGKKGVKGKY